jgi:hypothetical protein
MNADEMLDYAFGQLDGSAREQAERGLCADPAAACRVERLTRAVRLLVDADDDDDYRPPPDLARRTIAFVAAARERRRSIFEFAPVRVPFRAGDVAVAAGILIAALLTLLPPASRARDRMAQAGCSYNLQQLGLALWQYANHHHHYPSPPAEEESDEDSGSYLVMLGEDGLLPDLSVLDCPCNGRCRKHPPVPHVRDLRSIRRQDPTLYGETLHSDYAYNISLPHCGFSVDSEVWGRTAVALLADQPDHDGYVSIRPGNSPNHGGRGQNVLYSDLHVGWHPTRRLGPQDGDMYLNKDGQLNPGQDATDAVFTPSLVPFGGLGRYVPVSR